MPTTWNPSDKSAAFTLSGGNLHAVASSGGEVGCRATVSRTTGKFYWEITITDNVYHATQEGVGLETMSQSLAGMNSGAGGLVLGSGLAIVVNGTVIIAGGSQIPSGGVVCLAADLDNQRFWAKCSAGGYANWNNNATYDPATNVGGVDISGAGSINGQACAPAVIRAGLGNTVGVTANFGDTAYAFTAPSGFGNWLSLPPTFTHSFMMG